MDAEGVIARRVQLTAANTPTRTRRSTRRDRSANSPTCYTLSPEELLRLETAAEESFQRLVLDQPKRKRPAASDENNESSEDEKGVDSEEESSAKGKPSRRGRGRPSKATRGRGRGRGRPPLSKAKRGRRA